MRLVPAEGPGDPLHVVLVEDDQAFAQMYKLALELAGIEVLIASNGRAGLELVAKVRPDLIVLDLGLPDMNGVDVLGRLKSHAATRHIPVGILSIDSSESTRRLCRALGAIGYLAKTATTPKLLAETVPSWAAGFRSLAPEP